MAIPTRFNMGQVQGSGADYFLRLLQEQGGAGARPSASITGGLPTARRGTPIPLMRKRPPMPQIGLRGIRDISALPAGGGMTSLQRDLAAKMGLGAQKPETPKAPPSLMDRLTPAVGTPAFAGLSEAAATGLQLSGWQDKPITTGQGLGAMFGAGMKAFREAQAGQLETELTKAKIQSEKSKSGQIFSGTSFTAQSYNKLIEIGDKIKDGTASDAERQAYSLIYQKLSMPEEETRQTDAGVVTVKRPAMDLSAFPTPAGVTDSDERVIGERRAKFNEGESKAAGFANRIKGALATISGLEDAGYDASNLTDFVGEGLPAPLSGLVTSNQGQQYQTAKSDFITAVLRKESGAAIAESEFVREDKKYFPQPNDTADTIAQKAKMREKALEAMIAQSGAAYEVLFPEEQASLDLPEGSKLLREIGSKKYYETPDGDILVVD